MWILKHDIGIHIFFKSFDNFKISASMNPYESQSKYWISQPRQKNSSINTTISSNIPAKFTLIKIYPLILSKVNDITTTISPCN